MQPLRFLSLATRAVVPVLFVVALTACGSDDKAPPAGPQAAVVTTAEIALRDWNDTIPALGTVQSRESITVTAKVSEVVDRVHFESGQEVERNTVLVTLSGNQQQAALAAAEAAATEADRLFERQRQLADQQLISTASLDTQSSLRATARARVDEIRANLGDRLIRAPFAGVVGIRRVSPGALVQPGTEIVTLDDISSVYVDFTVPEAQLANLAVGQTLLGTSIAYPDRTFQGRVDTIDARIDPATRAVTVRGDFPNPDRVLKPGMLVQVDLQRPSRQALVVPEIAVIQVGRDTFVYRVLDGDVVEQAPIRVGSRVSGLAEVVEGLSPGDRIVVDGTGKLRAGMRIQEAARGAGPQPGLDDDGRAILPETTVAPAPDAVPAG
ncbi:efflux RND transporter periplasmic adaptor subunit [Luteimonas yindakuii]|uniref:efflux RND transporter periplasmic adaptor subunit n=1 Tax=Luteimonas yindakuii TaxID=2565782 RepID=UPI0010A35A12|nr:efflux RND transporter periplasmic adaptor subunit [Luteimonas yindakuii]QCO67180.1 efflux RND transporter periplasmic adaptor subunit [Luteimonas yindakuii]